MKFNEFNIKNFILHNKIKIFVGIAITLPVLWIVYFALCYSTNVLAWDSIEVVRLFQKFTEGKLAFKDLFAQHNEHRMFFPKLIFLSIAGLFNLNNKALVAVNVIFLLCSYALLLYRYLTTSCEELNMRMFLPILGLGFLILNGISYDDILWGFQIAWTLIILCIVASLFFMEKYFSTNKYNFLIISLLFAVISSFSSMHGLWVWLVYFVVFSALSLRGKEYRIKIKDWIFVFGIGLFCFLSYFHNYSKPAHHPKYFGDGFLPAIQYFFTAKGGIFTTNKIVAYDCGIIIFIIELFIMIYWFLYDERRKISFLPIGLILFSDAFVASISIGRSGFGIEQAISPRYFPNILFGFVGLFLFFLEKNNQDGRIFKVIKYLFFTFVFVLIGRNFYLDQNETYRNYKNFEEQRRKITLNYKSSSLDEYKIMYPWGKYSEGYQVFLFMENKKLGSFCDAKIDEVLYRKVDMDNYITGKIKYETIPLGYIDENKFYEDSELYKMAGWFVDEKNKTVLENVLLIIDGVTYEALYGIDREDVAQYLKNEKCKYSGFNFAINKNTFCENTTIKLMLIGKDGYYWGQSFQAGDLCENLPSSFPLSDVLANCNEIASNDDLLYSVDDKDFYSNGCRVRGWLFDNRPGIKIQSIYLQVDEKAFPVNYNLSRPDVADYFSNKDMANTGFDSEFTINGVSSAQDIALLVLTSNGDYYRIGLK